MQVKFGWFYGKIVCELVMIRTFTKVRLGHEIVKWSANILEYFVRHSFDS